MSQTRTVVYIDGFNLYHAIDALEQDHLKWVNLHALSLSLLQHNDALVAVRYFTAYATWLPNRYKRHRKYISALKSVGVDVHIARFKEKPGKCNSCGAEWINHEEKETDVRIALTILEDSTDGSVEKVIIISADSDLVPVIQSLKKRHPKIIVCVAVPPKMFKRGRDLQANADIYFQISSQKISEALLPGEISLPDGSIINRPDKYFPPS